MLFNQNNRPAIRGIILTSLLILAGCGNSEALESFVSADPELKRAEQKSPTDKSRSPQEKSFNNREELSQRSQTEPANRFRDDNTGQNEVADDAAAGSNEVPEAVSQVSNLPFGFPDSFPVYPQAELQEIESVEDNSGKLIWNTTDNRKAVADYYQTELSANGWDIIKPFTIDSNQKIARAIAVKDDLRVELSLMRSATDRASDEQNTELTAVYHPVGEDIPKSSISQAVETTDSETNSLDSNPERSQPEAAEVDEPIPKSYADSSNDNFTDLDEVPEQLQQPLKSVAALGILTPYTGESNVELSKFAPNRTITRGEYARWLVAANNRYFSDNPGKKIYIASKTTQPAFKDVGPDHPDFTAIQSLAEAGLIPSRLTEDSTNLLFRPDAPLTRENLITWKVPLDTRQSLPQATIEAIEESWGFQDAASTDSSAIRALYADFQNGDRSNIRRIFGYTTLFQPKKPVSRAEAGASLGYFGFQGDGISAREISESETEADSQQSTVNNQ